ncbi:MAG: AsmA family protein, partial [Deltaproteobacteria bacterium]|nr:AsmA family protein [Deltaproteobacteria bacterium]
MNRPGKIVTGLIACLIAVFILLLAAVLIVPKMIDSEAVKAKVRSEIKETAGVEIDYQRLHLDFFPHPHVIFDQVTLSIPPGVRGEAVSVRVHPKILPLFLGKMQIAGLRLDSAKLDYTLTKKSATGKINSQPFSLYELGKKIQSFISRLPEFKIPELDFQVINSKVNLFDRGRKIMALRSVNSHLEGPPAGRKITLNCKSNLWQRISMSGLLNTRTFKGSGQIQLTQFRPQGLVADLFPGSALQITDAPADLTIDFKTEGPGQLQAEAHGSTPHLKFRNVKKELNIKNLRIKAAFLVDKNSVALSLTELALDYPQLKLTANLTLTQNTPPLNLQIKGTQIDVASTRRVALALSGKNDVVKDIFDVVRGGNIPLITLKSQGQSLSDLGNTDNMVIQGQMRDGEIRIPGIQFDLKDASGDVVISRGILQGENLRARLCGISMAGTLKASPKIFEFDLEAIAKDQELEPLKTCLAGETFKADGTYNLKGRFQGRGKAEELLKTVTGQVEFTAKDGYIYHDVILVKVLRFLNTLEVLTGKVNFKD